MCPDFRVVTIILVGSLSYRCRTTKASLRPRTSNGSLEGGESLYHSVRLVPWCWLIRLCRLLNPRVPVFVISIKQFRFNTWRSLEHNKLSVVNLTTNLPSADGLIPSIFWQDGLLLGLPIIGDSQTPNLQRLWSTSTKSGLEPGRITLWDITTMLYRCSCCEGTCELKLLLLERWVLNQHLSRPCMARSWRDT